MEEKIVSSIMELNSEKIKALYKNFYFKELKEILKFQREELKSLGLKSIEVFHDIWPRFLSESELRANNVISFINKNEVFGEELWKKLTPKYMTEIKLYSERLMLKGIIDRVEINEEHIVPYELKTGNPPREGVWPGQKIQLIAYMLLIKEKMGKDLKYGYIHYINIKEDRKIVLTPFSEIEVSNTINEMKKVLGSEDVPPILKNKNKCVACNLREQCYKFNQSDVKF